MPVARQSDQDTEEYFLGLDLGQAADFSALAAIRRRTVSDLRRTVHHYTIRGLRRWPLGTLYTAIVADVADLVSKPPLAGCTLGVDWTGVGKPVVDMLREAGLKAALRPVLITAGHATTTEGAGFHVPKRELVAVLQVLLQARRLEVPATLAEQVTLEKELLAFRAKITTAANEVFEADWRTAPHDDLVLAVAIATWLGERLTPQRSFAPYVLSTRQTSPRSY